MQPELMHRGEVCRYFGGSRPLNPATLYRGIRQGRYPKPVKVWFNAFDTRDVVALYPLDGANFPVTPAIENYAGVNNHTDNRHGIAGYLDDPVVAKRILGALAAL